MEIHAGPKSKRKVGDMGLCLRKLLFPVVRMFWAARHSPWQMLQEWHVQTNMEDISALGTLNESCLQNKSIVLSVETWPAF